MLFVIMLNGMIYTSGDGPLKQEFSNSKECYAVAAKFREADKTVASAFCSYTGTDEAFKKEAEDNKDNVIIIK